MWIVVLHLLAGGAVPLPEVLYADRAVCEIAAERVSQDVAVLRAVAYVTCAPINHTAKE